MKKSIAMVVTLFVLGAASPSAQGFYWFTCAPPPCPQPVCVTYETRMVAGYRPVWKAEKVDVMVDKVAWRMEKTRRKVEVMVPRWTEVRHPVVRYRPVARVENREYVACRMVPCTVVDPFTCCLVVACRPEYVRQVVPVTVCDWQAEKGEEVVQVCNWVKEDRMVEDCRWVPVVTREKVATVRYRCDYEPCMTPVCVPVYNPVVYCPPPAWYCPAPWCW